jgi:hypothetical protein
MTKPEYDSSRLIPYAILLTLAVSPPVLLVGLLAAPLSSPVFQKRFGTLLQNLSLTSRSHYLFNFFFIFRRFLYGLSIALLPSSPGLQITLQLLMSISHLTYVVTVFPYSLRLDNYFEILNESTILCVLTASMRFADLPFSPEVSSNLGFALIGIITLNIAINMLFFLWENILLVYGKIKQLKCIRDRAINDTTKTVKIQSEQLPQKK